jgi:periplasmic protein TonB
MFDSIVEEKRGARHLGKGAVASIAVHALLLGGVIYAGRSLPKIVEQARTVTFFDPPAPPPPPPPPAGGGAPKVEKKPKKIKPKDTIVQAEKPVEAKPDPEPTPAETTPDPQPGGVAGGVQGGVAGGVVGGTLGGVLGGTLGGTGTKPSSSVLPFGAGMTRPSPVSQSEIVYTREAKAAHVEGLALVKCTIMTTGKLSNCRTVKALPHMEQAVLASVSRWEYTPITYQGHAVSVDYVIKVQLVAP